MKSKFLDLYNLIMESINVNGDAFEKLIANNINYYFKENNINLIAQQTQKGTKYSDIEILNKNGDIISFIETKLNHSANLFSKRLNVRNGKFVPMSNIDEMSESSVSKKLCDMLNNNEQSLNWLNLVANEVIQIPLNDLNLTSQAKISEKSLNWGIFKKLENYFKSKNKYILKQDKIDLKDILIDHYTSGKAFPASYIQIDDDFYKINDYSDGSGFKFINIPYLKDNIINGKCNVRLSLRSHGYEIIPELKVTEKMQKSLYSFKDILNINRLPKTIFIDKTEK